MSKQDLIGYRVDTVDGAQDYNPQDRSKAIKHYEHSGIRLTRLMGEVLREKKGALPIFLPSPEGATRDALYREICALYQPFMRGAGAQFIMRVFMTEKFGVDEARLMTIEQLTELRDYMKGQV